MRANAVILAALFGLLSCAAGMVIITAGDAPQPVNECSKGPEYWCRDIRTAKSCRATKHCIQTVWERQTVAEDNDNICKICKDMVQEARDTLLSNETQEEMKEVFEGSCKLIPIKLVKNNCIKMVDDFVPELIEMLASQMNPTMVCTTAWLCNNQWTDGLQAEYKAARESESPVAKGSCDQCKAFMSHNAKKLKASSLQDVQRVLFGVCGQLNSYSDACMALVADNIEKIYKFIEGKLDEEACSPLGFCPAEKAMRVSIQPLSNDIKFEAKMIKNALLSNKIGDDLECEFCQALVKNLRNILISNTTESEFVTVLRSICLQTGNFAKECTGIVDMYAEVIYSFIVNELDPNQACRLLTLCPLPGLKQEFKIPSSYLRFEPEGVETVPAVKLTQAEKTTKKEELAPLPIERLMPSALYENEPKKPGCILCEYVLKEVVAELRNSTVEEEIEATLKTICHRLPLPIGNECAKMVDQYGDAILYMLAQELDPSVLCVELQMCPANPTPQVKLPKKPFKSPANDPNACALCEFVVTMAEHKLENNHTEESVRKTLENICQHMPKSIRQDCVNFVDVYSKQIIEMLVAEFTPDEVCVAMKLCNPKSFILGAEEKSLDNSITVGEFLEKIEKDKEQVDEKKPVGNTPMCVMCEFAMATLEKKILTNNTEEEIKRAIDFLCAHLPETVADMCIDFVEEYGDEIFKLITGQIAPKAVCIQLGICIPEDETIQKLLGHPFEEPKKLLGHKFEQNVDLSLPNKCEICEVVVEYLDKLLQDDTIEESIDHVIEKACVLIPRGAKDRCTAMVETYGPYLISQIGELMDKTKVCQSLHLCKPPAGLVELLGGIRCTWGPSYWCVSPNHASACNALEHCQKQVWMKSEP